MSTLLSFILFIGYAYAQTFTGFDANSYTLTEGDTQIIQISVPSDRAIVIEIVSPTETLGEGQQGAEEGADFSLLGQSSVDTPFFPLTISDNAYTKPANTQLQALQVTSLGNSLVENDKVFQLMLPDDAAIFSPAARLTVEVVIQDNDTARVNFILPASNQLREDSSPLEIIVRLSQNFGSGFVFPPLFVNIDVPQTQSATFDRDYTLSIGGNRVDSEPFRLLFTAGLDSQTLTLTLIDDVFMEGLEFFDLSLELPTTSDKISLGTNDSLTLEIIDNDQTNLQVGFESSTVSLAENADPLEISLELAPQLPPAHPLVTVEVRVAPDTAQINDFTLSYGTQVITDQIVSLTVQFDNVSTQIITLAPRDDTLIEQNEILLLEIQETPTLSASVNRTLTVTIEDNDVQIRFDDGDGRLDVAEDINMVTIDVILSRSVSMIDIEISVDSVQAALQTSPDSEYDYRLLDHTLSGNSFFVRVEPGAVTASFDVGIHDDQVIETTESFTLRIPPQSFSIGGLDLTLIPINELDVRIIDNDSITVILSPENLESRVVEEGKTIPVDVRLSRGQTLSSPDTVEVTLIVGRNLTTQNATLNQDYRINSEIRAYIVGNEDPMSAEEISVTERNDETSITLRFTTTIVRYEIDLVILPDSTVEGDEFLQITTAEPPPGVMIRGRQDFRITIRDANSPQWNITGPGEVREGDTVDYTVAYETEIDRSISVLISLETRIDRSDVNDVDQDDDFTLTPSFADSLVAQAAALSELIVEKESDQGARLRFMPQSSRQFFTFSLTIVSDQQFEGPEGYQITLSSPQVGDLSEFANREIPIPGNRSQITTIIREELDTPALREMSKVLTPLILRSVTPYFFHTVKDRVTQAFTRPHGQAPLIGERGVSFDLSGIRSSLTQTEIATLPPTRWDAWLSGRWTSVEDSQTIAVQGNILTLWSGMSYRPTESTLIGLLVGYEGSSLDIGSFRGNLEGQGYSAGGYVGLRFSGLTWHMAGSFTTLTYDAQSFDEASEFDAIRFTASTDLSGTLTVEPLIIRPSLSLLGAWEIQEEYRYGDERQFYVEEQRFIFSRVSLGPEFVFPWSIDDIVNLEPFLDIRLDYDAYHDIPRATVPNRSEPTVAYVVGDTYADLDRLSGHIRFGINGYITKRFKFGVSGEYANLFKENNPEISGSANLSYRWGEDGRLLRLSATDGETTALKATLELTF